MASGGRSRATPTWGDFNSAEQEPDGVSESGQAADGTWQLWGCIRKTNVGGNTRLFYRWEGDNITGPGLGPEGNRDDGRA